MGAVSEALELYQSIHEQHPDNLECLRYLVALSRDLGRRTAVFEERLAKLERASAAAAAAREQQGGGEEEEAYQDAEGGEGGYVYHEERAPPPPAVRSPPPPRAPAPAAASPTPQPQAGGFGSSSDRFAAPSNFAGSSSRVGAGGDGGKDGEFADTDLGGLLQ